MRSPLRSILYVSVAALSWGGGVHAAAISGVAVTDLSDANGITASGNNRVVELQTQATSLGTVQAAGLNALQFTSHFQWTLAEVVAPDTTVQSPNFALGHSVRVAYEMAFTIEDSAGVGYTLDIGTALRGFLTAALDANQPLDPSATAGAAPRVTTTGTTMYGRFDSGSGFGSIQNGLTLNGGQAEADANTVFANVLVAGTDDFSAGAFVGTQTFRLLFSSAPSPNAGINLQNYTRGEGGVRFGLDPTHVSGGDPTRPDFDHAFYPGTDGEPADQHGHFVTVTATFNESVAVPAPPAGAMLVFAIAGLAALRRRGGRFVGRA